METFGWLPLDWIEYGARWGKDNRLYLAEYRHGFEIHQLRALFFDCQQIRSLRAELRQALRDIEQLEMATHHPANPAGATPAPPPAGRRPEASPYAVLTPNCLFCRGKV